MIVVKLRAKFQFKTPHLFLFLSGMLLLLKFEVENSKLTIACSSFDLSIFIHIFPIYCTSRYCKLGPFNLQRSQDSKACCDLWVNRARMLLARWKGARLWVELLFLWTSAKLGSLKIIVRESKCNLAILHVPPELALFGKQNFFFFLSEFHIPICCETFHGTSFRQGETNFHGFFIWLECTCMECSISDDLCFLK